MEAREFFHEGVRYAYRHRSARGGAAGSAEESPCAPLVLVHGFAQSGETWATVTDALAAAGHESFAFDLVGHGLSAKPQPTGPYALAHQGEALAAYLGHVRDLAGQRPVLVGYSMGGRVALAAVAAAGEAARELLSALVLESAGLGAASEPERQAAAKADAARAERLRAQGVRSFMDAWQELPLFSTQKALPQPVRDAVRAGRLANDAEALARTFEHAGQHAMAPRDQTVRQLQGLRRQGVPVTYLFGALDHKYAALGEQLSALGAADRVVAVPEAGHSVHLERPGAFVQALLTPQ